MSHRVRYKVTWRSLSSGGTKTKEFSSYSSAKNFTDWAKDKLSYLRLIDVENNKTYKVK